MRTMDVHPAILEGLAPWVPGGLKNGGSDLDFSRPFLPESMARTSALSFLDSRERLVLNQIRGVAYLSVFDWMESVVLPYAPEWVLPEAAGQESRLPVVRALRQDFAEGFGTACRVVGPPSEIAEAVLQYKPLTVAMVVLHLEWMTQRHYADSFQPDQAVEPRFKRALGSMSESNARSRFTDRLITDVLLDGMTRLDREQALLGYLDVGAYLDACLRQQAQFDMESLRRATGRVLTEDEAGLFLEVQTQACRWMYLGSGMTHPNFLGMLERIAPSLRERIESIAPVFC